MKFTKTKANSLFTLILVFNTMSVQAEATRDDEMRILIVGTRGQSRFSAADLLSGRKDGGQEDREIVKTPVITEEGHRMMLVTGPNLCEENTARQTLTTAVFLSSPGPHAVLMVLNLEDQQSQQCDIVKRAQELLGEEVLQYCIVLLHLNHQEDLTGASRKIINASSHDEFLRILIVGTRGRSNFSAADLLSGEKDGGQEDGEIVKAPVITDEGRRMMLVTGPNLCEEDTVRQTFTTALFLSSPGPHVILMVLNLEDQQSQQCDIVKRAQELLGAKVLQYCIVLFHQNTKEHLTGASRWIAGDIINACGGRFHVIKDSEPKPAQIAALVAEIDKLVLLNDHSFYSVLTEDPKTEETLQDVHEENPLLSIIYYTLGGAVGTVASHDGEMRILTVGIRGQSRFNTADLMSGRKDSGQEDREIVKTPRITDEGRRMMLVTGPNLCEEDTARQTFTTALFLLSPGPHAVLMVLNLEDQQSQQCDIVKQAQELLGAGVLQYCIVLLLQNHQEHLTGASREIINACGGRFLLIRDSEPKPAQTAALIAEIDRIVSLNDSHDYDDNEVRIVIVGIRGHSRFSAADLLSERKDGGQEDREIVKTPVITDEGRRMMLVTGPNLCEEDTARQTFITALFSLSPGPHAILMVLNLEDQQSQQCDIVKQAQELLGTEVLHYCIVLLLQNHQEHLTGASGGIDGEIINASSHDDEVRILIVGIRG
ncbi:hypothetical protein Q8A67_025813 [Cirrhinus molitorella]|uniref:AIG1-type G domain-containing protein n=1 Tax=Cirrhinus molitorella TaxID=172907 RepID=A0AA88P0B3_9TELE|nr:hypothetical protein Q8A67_025813 [Cirrhinus molitorella]